MQILDLPSGQLLTLSAARARQVQVLYGRIWLTETGRSEDVFAASGDQIDLSRDGQVLIEGLGFARVAVLARADAGVRARRSLRRLPRQLRMLWQRLQTAVAGSGAARPAA